jgi:serine/threonine protein kinase
MEPISCNLSEIIRHKRAKEQSWADHDFLKLCKDLTSALDSLHLAGITHNDIRCSNVFYSEEKSAFILGSFGNSRNCHQ